MKITKDFFHFQNLTKSTLCLLLFLSAIIVLAYIIPITKFQVPPGSDVFFHMYNTFRMTSSNSLFNFYEKSFEEESTNFGYPFGLWFFGSIIMKVTGMSIDEIAYILPLILLIALVFIYYVYTYSFLLSKNKAIFASIFLISMPLITLSLLQYATRVFIIVILISIIYLSINELKINTVFITSMLVFSLVFTHTGTYMFLLFFSIVYFILYAFFWKKFASGMYFLIVSLLFFYVIAIQLFPYIQTQYIDKGRMVLDLSSKFGLEFAKNMGKMFYDRIFVDANLIDVIFWSSFIYAIGRFLQSVRLKAESLYNKNLLAIPVIGNLKHVSHGIITAPFWLGPIHTFLSIFGIFKLDPRGKCIALSLALTSLFPGAMQSGGGTGSLREIYYLYLIIPVSSAAGFYYLVPIIKRRINRIFAGVLILILILPLISAPIIGSLYYIPIISGTKNEKENLIWLSNVGTHLEGVPNFAYRERIDLYANKITPEISYGNEMRRYENDLKNTYFSENAEEYTKDLHSFNIEYIISSERTLKGYGKYKDSLQIDSNKQLDKIYSSDKSFSIYRYISPPKKSKISNSEESILKFEDAYPNIIDFGSVYFIENDFYKLKISKTSPEIKYIGTKTKNILGEGGFSDYIGLSRGNNYKRKYAGYSLNELKYPYVSVKNNEIIYKTIVRDKNNTENWATLIVKYTFYEKAIKREIIIANDWVSLDSDLYMNIRLSTSLFAPISDFEFSQLGYKQEKVIKRKIYPSQGSIILKDKKFNEIYFNENDVGLFIKYGDLVPYPSKIYYGGSTLYKYGHVSIDSSFSISPSKSIDVIQYFSVGDKLSAENNINRYTSFAPYMYPNAEIPIIIVGYNENNGIDSNIYNYFQNHSVIYNEGIDFLNNNSLKKGVNPIGYVKLYEKRKYKNYSTQNEDIKRIKTLSVKGILFKSFKYNLNTIKILSDNNLIFALAYTVPSPFMEFFREGLRNPELAYYHGEKKGVVLIPVTRPSSSLLSPVYNVENVFSQWNETIDSVVENGGMAVFLWNIEDISNPEYIDRVMGIINYSKSKGMNFTTPDAIAKHFKLMQKVSTTVKKGIDYVTLNSTNHNKEEVKGVTYLIELPILDNSCPYNAVNAHIPRKEIKEGNYCRLYVSFDLKAGEKKEVKVEPEITRKRFELGFSDLYEGGGIIRVKDDKGNPVAKAKIYIDLRSFESDNKGEVRLNIRRGLHKIRVEKPGFVSKDYEIEVKGRIYKLLNYFK